MNNINLTLDENLVPYSWKYLLAVLMGISSGRFEPLTIEESDDESSVEISLEPDVHALFEECLRTRPVEQDVFDRIEAVDDSGKAISMLSTFAAKIGDACDGILQKKGDYPDFFLGRISVISENCQLIADIVDCYMHSWPQSKSAYKLWYDLFDCSYRRLLNPKIKLRDGGTVDITYSLFRQIMDKAPFIEIGPDFVENEVSPLSVGFQTNLGMAAYFFVILLMSGKVIEEMDCPVEQPAEFLVFWRKSKFKRFGWNGYSQHRSEKWLDAYIDVYAAVHAPEIPDDRRGKLSSFLRRPVFEDILSTKSLLKNHLGYYTTDIMSIRTDIALRSMEGMESLHELYCSVIGETNYLLLNRLALAKQFCPIDDKDFPCSAARKLLREAESLDALIRDENRLSSGNISEMLESRDYLLSYGRLAGKPEFGPDKALDIIDDCIKTNDIMRTLIKNALEENETASSSGRTPIHSKSECTGNRKEWILSQLQERGYIDEERNIVQSRAKFARAMVENGYARPNGGWEEALTETGNMVNPESKNILHLGELLKTINWNEWDAFNLRQNGVKLTSRVLKKALIDKVLTSELESLIKMVRMRLIRRNGVSLETETSESTRHLSM